MHGSEGKEMPETSRFLRPGVQEEELGREKQQEEKSQPGGARQPAGTPCAAAPVEPYFLTPFILDHLDHQ